MSLTGRKRPSVPALRGEGEPITPLFDANLHPLRSRGELQVPGEIRELFDFGREHGRLGRVMEARGGGLASGRGHSQP